MKATFTCRACNLNLSIDPGKPMQAYFPGGQRTVTNVSTIKFRNHQLITEDKWEKKQVRKWMQRHPEDGIKEIKNADVRASE